MAAAEHHYGIAFGDDHRALLSLAVPTDEGWVDWRHGDEAAIRRQLAWPLDGVVWELLNSEVWPGVLGASPRSGRRRARGARSRAPGSVAPLGPPLQAALPTGSPRAGGLPGVLRLATRRQPLRRRPGELSDPRAASSNAPRTPRAEVQVLAVVGAVAGHPGFRPLTPMSHVAGQFVTGTPCTATTSRPKPVTTPCKFTSGRCRRRPFVMHLQEDKGHSRATGGL